ncbi:MAG: hypothetical protein H0W33_01575 [Gammaproteobacteria bacterium]|nr:hypothetical protein [Gammaproteobacteria bacterium]
MHDCFYERSLGARITLGAVPGIRVEGSAIPGSKIDGMAPPIDEKSMPGHFGR